MARGGYRPGAGRPRKSEAKAKPVEAPKKAEIAPEVAADEGLTPLAYMLKVMRDETVDYTRRDRMAIAAAPFAHVRPAEERAGKKTAQAKAARTAGGGKFAPAMAPKLVVSNG